MNETLTEVVSIGSGSTVDRKRGVVCRVRLLELAGPNARTYTQECVRRAVRDRVYEACTVNADHSQSSINPRNYRDRIGTLRHVRADGGLCGTLYVNTRHTLADKLFREAETASGGIRLSHCIGAQTSRRSEGAVFVQKIETVRSVDVHFVCKAETATGSMGQADLPADKAARAAAAGLRLGLPVFLVDYLLRAECGYLRDCCQSDEAIERHLLCIYRSLVESGELPATPPRDASAAPGVFLGVNRVDHREPLRQHGRNRGKAAQGLLRSIT